VKLAAAQVVHDPGGPVAVPFYLIPCQIVPSLALIQGEHIGQVLHKAAAGYIAVAVGMQQLQGLMIGYGLFYHVDQSLPLGLGDNSPIQRRKSEPPALWG